jgi:polyisoprenoid-binding protein YceI
MPSWLSPRRPRTWLIAGAVVVLLVAVVAPWVYINFIKEEAPERLTFESADSTSTSAAAGSSTTALAAEGADIDGAWSVGQPSQAGYRVGEVLFGQDTEAAGRTTDVTGAMTIDGTTIETASFTVDMTTVSSDESRRDGQFRNRIMDVATHPTATFELTDPIELQGVPADLEEVTVAATGDFTIRGVTRSVTFDLRARRNGAAIEVNGSFPVVFADFGIPDASGGPATVKDNGEIEFLLTFTR